MGRYAAERGIDLLIGVRGAARVMVEAAARRPASRRDFFDDPDEAGDLVREVRAAGRCRPVQRIARRAGGKGAGKVYGVAPMLYFLLYEQLYRQSARSASSATSPSRTAFASLTALFLCIVLGPWLISKLREFQIGQYIREDGPKSHQKKAGTPTMGGVLIIISIVIPTLLWADLRNPYVWIALFALLAFGGIGFLDDYAKVTKQRNLGSAAGASWSTDHRGLRLRRVLLFMRACGDFTTAMNVPFFKQFQPSLLMPALMANPWTYVSGCRAVLHLRGSGGGLLSPMP